VRGCVGLQMDNRLEKGKTKKASRGAALKLK